MRSTEASSSQPMPAPDAIKNTCSTAAASGTAARSERDGVTRCRTASHHRLGRNQQQKPSELARSAEFRHRAESLRVIFDVGRERMKAVCRGFTRIALRVRIETLQEIAATA